MASVLQTITNTELFDTPVFPEAVNSYPQLRYMGNKYRLLPWIHALFSELNFKTALDAFSGSGCVSYLLKTMGKKVQSNDFLEFAHQISLATIENSRYKLSKDHCEILLEYNPRRKHFIEKTYKGIFYTPEDLRFLDNIWANIDRLPTRHHKALTITALIRSCLKRQPRGVFTVAGDPDHYKDGRRDLRLSLQEHFLESVKAYNSVVINNQQHNSSTRLDVFQISTPEQFDLVYMDPPYVPRSDDNCYIKRYHFLEGLSSYWRDEGTDILESTKVKKIPKRFTPFSYRRTAIDAFDRMFRHFKNSTLVLSYSSNGYPDLKTLILLMKKHKRHVDINKRNHRYHFGTHNNVSKRRVEVHEYLIVGT